MKNTEKPTKEATEKQRNTSQVIFDLKSADSLPANQDPQTMTAAETDFNYYKNRIDGAIAQYEIENGVSVKEIKKTEWNAVLIYIYQNVFKLDRKQNIQKYKYKPYNDSELMLLLCDYYIYLCYLYNKPINIMGYNHMLNLSDMYLNRYSKDKYNTNNTDIYIDIDNNNKYINSNSIELYKSIYNNHNIIRMPNDTMLTIKKKLVYNSERAIEDMALDGSVMALAVGKIKHGWIESAKEKIQVEMLENYRLPSDLIDKYSDNS